MAVVGPGPAFCEGEDRLGLGQMRGIDGQLVGQLHEGVDRPAVDLERGARSPREEPVDQRPQADDRDDRVRAMAAGLRNSCGSTLPTGMTPSAIAVASITSAQTTDRQMTFLWWSARLTRASDTSSSSAGTSGLVMCTGCPTIEARAISTGVMP